MRVHLNYGRGLRAVDLPDELDVTVIAKKAMPLLADPRRPWKRRSPGPWLARCLRRRPRVPSASCILICDFTRPVPNGVILPPLIRTLPRRRAGA